MKNVLLGLGIFFGFYGCEFSLFNISDQPRRASFSREYPQQRYQWIMNTYGKYVRKSKSYNREMFVFVDYRKTIAERRFYIVYPKQDLAFAYKVAHGYGSDRNGDGRVDRVGNRKGSGMSSEGVFVITRRGSSKQYPKKLMMCGLSSGNSRAAGRDLLVHPAKRDGKDYLNQQKFSAGCFAVNVSVADSIMDTIGRRGTLILASYTDRF